VSQRQAEEKESKYSFHSQSQLEVSSDLEVWTQFQQRNNDNEIFNALFVYILWILRNRMKHVESDYVKINTVLYCMSTKFTYLLVFGGWYFIRVQIPVAL